MGMRFAFLFLVLAGLAHPQRAAKKASPAIPPKRELTLTVDHIMRGPNLYGWAPNDIRWSGDSKRIYFRWKQWNDPQDADPDLYVVERDGSSLRKLTEDDARLAPPTQGDWTKDWQCAVYALAGDLYIYDAATDRARRLTKTSAVEGNPRWLRDGKRIAFESSGNLHVLTVDTGYIETLTTFTNAPVPEDERKGTESQEYLKKEEEALLEIVKQRNARKKDLEERRKRDNPRKPIRLTARQTVASLLLSPDEKYIYAFVRENAEGAKTAAVPNYITVSAYSEQLQARTKVGDLNPRTRLMIVEAATGEMKPLDTGLKAKDPKDEKKEIDREAQLFGLQFSEDGTKAVVTARATDNKDQWILAVDPATSKARVIVHQHDDAWVLNRSMSIGWMKGDAELHFLAERDAFLHLYTVPFAGGEPKQFTKGKWEILSAELSRDKSTFYLTTNETHPGEQHLYAMPALGGALTRLTTEPGQHDLSLSPDGQWIADTYSYINKPPELFVRAARAGADAKQLTRSPSPDFAKYKWTEPPVVTFAARDGAQVYARLYKPSVPNNAAVVFVHGAGYLQNAHRWWSQYSREYLFHHLLLERGYTVLDLDYRGSAGYGRDWRVGIYRYMGGKDLEDHVDGAKWLVSQHGIDPKRIGLYGGSYGGFITLMAMFTTPDVFAAGAALRPVTDWAQYNHPYTSNILNQPQKDPEAYKRSSPIYFAQNLKGALLICHGMVDVNVHYQDSVRLAQRLIELRKENWELASYPVEDHGFVQSTSWADEYKRILKLFEANLTLSGASAK